MILKVVQGVAVHHLDVIFGQKTGERPVHVFHVGGGGRDAAHFEAVERLGDCGAGGGAGQAGGSLDPFFERLVAGDALHKAGRGAVVGENGRLQAHQPGGGGFYVPIFGQPDAQFHAAVIRRLCVLGKHGHVGARRHHRHVLRQIFADLVEHAVDVVIEPHVVRVDRPQRLTLLRHLSFSLRLAKPPWTAARSAATTELGAQPSWFTLPDRRPRRDCSRCRSPRFPARRCPPA